MSLVLHTVSMGGPCYPGYLKQVIYWHQATIGTIVLTLTYLNSNYSDLWIFSSFTILSLPPPFFLSLSLFALVMLEPFYKLQHVFYLAFVW